MMRLTMVLVALALLAASGAVQAQTVCLERAYASYARAQRQYQRTALSLLTRDRPRYATIARRLHAHQVAMIDSRELAVRHLLRNDRAKLRLDRPVNQWLDWGPQESAALSARDAAYAKARARADSLRARASGHPDGEAVRTAMRRIAESESHQAAAEKLMRLADTVGAGCRPRRAPTRADR